MDERNSTISISRGQSRACTSYAEARNGRKKFNARFHPAAHTTGSVRPLPRRENDGKNNLLNRKTMIRLNVFIRTTATNRDETIAVAKELTAASLKDAGCIAYDLFESSTRPDVLMICETWSDAKALAAHEATAHFTTLVPRLDELGELKLEKFVF